MAEIQINSGPSKAGWHMASDFGLCGQYGAYRWILGLVPDQIEKPLARGILGHFALAQHNFEKLGRPARDPISAMQTEPDNVSYMFREMRAVVQDYIGRRVQDAFKLLDAEVELHLEVTGRFGKHPITARIDRVVRMAGRVWFRDYKFVGNVDAKHNRPEQWRTDGQVLNLTLYGRKLAQERWGLPFGGVAIDLIQTGATRSIRDILVRGVRPQDVKAHVRTLRYLWDMIHFMQTVYGDPWSYPRVEAGIGCTNFKGYGRRCPYYTLCWEQGRDGEHLFDIDLTAVRNYHDRTRSKT